MFLKNYRVCLALLIKNIRVCICRLFYLTCNQYQNLCLVIIAWYANIIISSMYMRVYVTVLNRCVSALPKSTCPFIPSRYLQQIKSRSSRDTSTPIRFPDTITALSQISVQEPAMQCEERRQLGSFILNKKAEEFDSLLSRFVGNLIMHISDKTSAQEVSVASYELH